MKRLLCHLPIACLLTLWINGDWGHTILGQEPRNPTKYLEAALKVENWLAAVQRVDKDGRVFWPTCPDESQDFTFDWYHGNTGVVDFYLDLHDATHEEKYLQRAIEGADHLQHKIDSLNSNEPPGLFTGVAGYGQTMIHVWKKTKQEKHKRAALRCIEFLESQAKSKESYVGNACHFNGVTDVISGSAGITGFLLYAHESLDSQASLELAIRCGDGLLADGIKTNSVDGKTEMLHWRMSDSLERDYPNMSHGTAGVCGALLKLDEALNVNRANRSYDQRFLDAAIKGGEYLKSIAARNEGQCLVFHHSPGGEDLFYLGWCHGPPGTSAVLLALGEIANRDDFTKMGRMGATTILKNGLFKNRTPGFWNNVGQCCGTAGVAVFLATMFYETNEKVYLAECRRLTEDLLNRATIVELPDGKVGLNWLQAEHRTRPDGLKAQTGFMQGAAGIGQWLLDMHDLESGAAR